ncbi:hypothetical protein FPOAC2_13471 [Fusarium poae]
MSLTNLGGGSFALPIFTCGSLYYISDRRVVGALLYRSSPAGVCISDRLCGSLYCISDRLCGSLYCISDRLCGSLYCISDRRVVGALLYRSSPAGISDRLRVSGALLRPTFTCDEVEKKKELNKIADKKVL